MSEVVYELKVGMTCDGCSGAVERILGKVEGISKVECNLETLVVLVTGVDGLDIPSYLAKWSASAGKSVEFIEKREA